jgi:hypothetical protein
MRKAPSSSVWVSRQRELAITALKPLPLFTATMDQAQIPCHLWRGAGGELWSSCAMVRDSWSLGAGSEVTRQLDRLPQSIPPERSILSTGNSSPNAKNEENHAC